MSTAEYQARWVKLSYLNGPLRVDAIGTTRRLRALNAMGWSLAELARITGAGRNRFGAMCSGRYSTTEYETRELVKQLYNQLSMREPTGPAVQRTRDLARAKGWAPPMAWDDEDIDNPNAKPQGVCRRRQKMTAAETLAEYHHFRDLGMSDRQIAERLGMWIESLQRAVKRAA